MKLKKDECFKYGTWETGPHWSVVEKIVSFDLFEEVTGYKTPSEWQKATQDELAIDFVDNWKRGYWHNNAPSEYAYKGGN